MISDYARYYGSVFTQVIEASREGVRLRKLDAGCQGFYIIDASIPLYVKFSRNRRGPWGFNFQCDHQIQIKNLVEQYGVCIIALVCGQDGVVALDQDQLKEVLDDVFDGQETISVRRKLRHMYSVKGSDGRLARKVSRDSLTELICDRLTEFQHSSAAKPMNPSSSNT